MAKVAKKVPIKDAKERIYNMPLKLIPRSNKGLLPLAPFAPLEVEMKKTECECKHTRTCIYGYIHSDKRGLCDFIGITGRSRVVNNPKGEIVNGICGEYIERKNGVRARARGTNGLCGRAQEGSLPEVGKSGFYGCSGPDCDPSEWEDLLR